MKALSKLKSKPKRLLFFCALMFALIATSSAAQAQTSRITGRTDDFPEGKRVLPNVPVTLVNPITGERETVSDERGAFCV